MKKLERKNGSIAVFGSINMDFTIWTQTIPDPGQTVLGKSFKQGFGGKGANQSIAASRMGVPTYLIGALGTDEIADRTLTHLQKEGIKTDCIQSIVSSESGTAVIIIEENGENRIINAPGANMQIDAEQAIEDLKRIPDLKVVLGPMDIPIPCIDDVFTWANESGIKTILNPSPLPPSNSDLFVDLLSKTDLLMPNRQEMEIIIGEKGVNDNQLISEAKVLCNRFCMDVLITLGENGSVYISRNGKVIRKESIRVNSIDTSGAGDCYLGTYAAAVASGQDVEAAMSIATVAAGIVVTKRGAQSAPQLEEVIAVAKNHKFLL